jgi:hypothetical protein
MGPGTGEVQTFAPPLDFWKNKSIEKKEIYQILIPKIKACSKNIFLYPEYCSIMHENSPR